MGYFPFFIDLKDRQGLIVGGGRVALHKIKKLLPFEPSLTVVAPEILPEIEEIPAICCRRCEFAAADLEGIFFAIAASDREEVNEAVSRLCMEKGILVNVVDDKDKCGFLFPSLVKEGALTIGVSTGGASPRIAMTVRDRAASELPGHMEEILDYLASIRSLGKEKIEDARLRAEFFKETADFCMEHDRVLSQEETLERIRNYISG